MKLHAQPSKSYTHRALFVSALAEGGSKILNPLESEDINHTINALKSFGVGVEKEKNMFVVHGTGGKLKSLSEEIFTGDSGTTMRFLVSLVSLAQGKTILTGSGRMQQRPVLGLVKALQQLGVEIETNNSRLPITINGKGITGGSCDLDAALSSQFLSSLLIASPYAKEKVSINVTGISSQPYVDITLDVMNSFGIKVKNNNYKSFIIQPNSYKPQIYSIEGDYSNASYLFAAAAIQGNEITVTNLNPGSLQGDKEFLSILEKMGCHVSYGKDSVTVQGPEKLLAVTADMNSCPDIVQTLAVVACFAEGTTTITNVAHLRLKETDRLESLAVELRKVGCQVKLTQDSISITPKTLKGANIETYNDHRMAMSFAVFGLNVPGVTIKNPGCVNKSYPEFWEAFKKLK